jgi:glycosyltransferase involved in cell wall biosynthesis
MTAEAFGVNRLQSAGAALRSCLNITAHIDHRFGGLTTSLPPFCEALAATGKYRAELAAFCAPDEVYSGADSPAIFPFGRLRWMVDGSLRKKLANLIRNADALHIHGIWQEHCAVAGDLALASGKPYLIAAHGMLEPWAFKSKGWKKRLYWELSEKRRLTGAGCLRALTVAEGEQYRALGLRVPVAVIPNGVTVPDQITPEPFFERYPELRGRKIVLFLGRLHPKKGIHMLCESWAKVCREFPDSHLVMAGPDFDGVQAALEAQIHRDGAASQVTFSGMLRGDEKWGALSAATTFALPSYSEGFSMAVLEALGVGLPVIVSKFCYFPEVQKYQCGWTIDPQPAPLENALRECLSASTEERETMALRGRRLIAEQFSWPVIGESTAAVLDWMLGGGAPPPCVVQ